MLFVPLALFKLVLVEAPLFLEVYYFFVLAAIVLDKVIKNRYSLKIYKNVSNMIRTHRKKNIFSYFLSDMPGVEAIDIMNCPTRPLAKRRRTRAQKFTTVSCVAGSATSDSK